MHATAWLGLGASSLQLPIWVPAEPSSVASTWFWEVSPWDSFLRELPRPVTIEKEPLLALTELFRVEPALWTCTAPPLSAQNPPPVFLLPSNQGTGNMPWESCPVSSHRTWPSSPPPLGASCEVGSCFVSREPLGCPDDPGMLPCMGVRPKATGSTAAPRYTFSKANRCGKGQSNPGLVPARSRPCGDLS